MNTDDRPSASSDLPPTAEGEPQTVDSAPFEAPKPGDDALLREGVGSRIGPYRILRQIGEGGFGAVFEAQQERPVERLVALKIIKWGMDTRQVIGRFEQERQALALMEHPNIAKVLDAGATATGRPFFVMELVRGEPITQYADRHALTIRTRLELFVQVCQAVQHAHQKGVIHRDLKPSNILVSTQDDRPYAKVIDFGIAKATSARNAERTIFTEVRHMIGTPEYMSPEQAEGSSDIDTRSDVYSLGVLLYELLTGTTPFVGKDLRSAAFAEVQRIIRDVDPPNPSARLSSLTDTIVAVAASRRTEPRRLSTMVRGDLDIIVMKSLEKDRRRRYETANGLGLDVQRSLMGEAILAAPASRTYRLRKFVGRNRVSVFAGLGVTMAILFGSALAVVGFLQASQQRDLAKAAEIRAVAEATRAMKAEATAVTDARTATQASDFLSDMLSGIAPKVALGRDTTLLREIVDKAAERIDSQLADQPAVAVRALRAIAGAYNELAVFDRAEKAIRRALELARTLPGDNRDAVAHTTHDLATVLESIGRYEEAKALFQESYDLFDAIYPGGDDSIDSLSSVGGVLFRVNDMKGAAAIFRTVYERRLARSEGRDSASLASSMDRLSLVLRNDEATFTEAEAMSRAALHMRQRLFGALHPDVALSLSNLAGLLAKQRKFEEAIPLSEEAITAHRALYGERHPYTAACLYTHASVLRQAGRLEDALPFSVLCLEIDRETLGPTHRTTLNAVFDLATSLDKLKRWSEAEEQYRAMLDYARATYAPGDNRTSGVIMLVAATLRNQDRQADAETLLREALDGRLKNRPAGHPQRAESRIALSECLVAQGKFADAETLLVAAEEETRATESSVEARGAAVQRLVEFYVAWSEADPQRQSVHQANAAQWRTTKDATTAPKGADLPSNRPEVPASAR